MFTIREATLDDVEGIRSVFQSAYGTDYAYPQYYDTEALGRLVYAPGNLLLVAVDDASGRVAGTASVVFSIAAQNDLVGEFGRLVVHPDFRGQGLGKQLMRKRIEFVQPRLHVGIVENRTSHTHSQRISERYGFVPVGFLPGKLLVKRRETIALYAQHFGDGVSLRRNNPRVIPEASRLAGIALENCQLPADMIVDDSSPSFPYSDSDELAELQTEGYASLLRIERGRVKHRQVFGPVRLHYGLFQLQSRHSSYLIARRGQQVTGGIGYLVDRAERAARIFELISVTDEPIRGLIEGVLRKCERDLDVDYIEVDVSAYAPRMQRTLLELGFLPVGYVPASVFHEVERLDAVKMARLLVSPDFSGVEYLDSVRPIADEVVGLFKTKQTLSELATISKSTPLFCGLSEEQRERLLGICTPDSFAPGTTLFRAGEEDSRMRLILSGGVKLLDPAGQPVAELGAGQCIGERTLLAASDGASSHTLTAIAVAPTETAVFEVDEFKRLIRRRPDVGVIVFRNLALDVGRKLRDASGRFGRQVAR